MLVAPLLLAFVLPAPDLEDASWIWGSWATDLDRPNGEACLFRHEFELATAPKSATLLISVDNASIVRFNGEKIGRTDAWERAVVIDLSEQLVQGPNTLEILARNSGGPAGLIAALEVTGREEGVLRFASGADWMTRRKSDPGAPPEPWAPAHVIAPYGEGPWGRVAEDPRTATPQVSVEERFEVPDGFGVSQAWSGLGSVIALTTDDRGRAFVALEGDGILVLTDADGDGAYEHEDVYSNAVKTAHGLAWKDGALYVVGQGPDGSGFYAIAPDAPDTPRLIGKLDGSGEHGPHAVVVGPDGDFYLNIGNHAKLEGEWSPRSPYRNYYEGHILPRYVDPRGHATNVDAPGGIIVRVTMDDDGGSEWRVTSGGLRNAYDLAFLSNGDLFTFDADMEWDLGLPWYREVRLLHLVPGGEYGWRTGSGKWPAWYPDSLPPAAEVGRGSPCGMVTYDGAMFPHRYTDAILAADWSRGRVIAFFPEPDGHSYTATHEELVLGRPLNATDVVVDLNGSVLISTGGRSTEGAVWRLSYAGDRGNDAHRGFAVDPPTFAGDATEPFDLVDVWASVDDHDRFARYATARELERRGVTLADIARVSWADNPRSRRMRAESLVAAVRNARERTDADEIASGLDQALAVVEAPVTEDEIGDSGLEASHEARRIALRGIELLLLDDDAPETADLGELGARLLALYPTGDRAADDQLVLLLAHLAPNGAVDALVASLAEETSRAGALHLLYGLRMLADGWTDASRRAVADWFLDAQLGGGSSYGGYVSAIVEDLEVVFGEEHAELLATSREENIEETKRPALRGEPWSFDGTEMFLTGALESDRRSLSEGARVFAASCARCHAFHGASGMTLPGAGGALGPDLAGVTRRFSRRDLLDSILNPSRVVPDAYRALDVFLADGSVVSGLVTVDRPDKLVLTKQDGATVEVDPNEIDERRPSHVSIMPEDLLAGHTLEEVADLFAYLANDAPIPADTEAPSEWTTLFDGETLDGWRFDPELWRVEEGLIVGRGEGLPGSSFLQSAKEYDDFLLEYDLRVVQGNSGLQFRSTPQGEYGLHGYQADAGQRYWGSLYEEGGRGMLHQTDEVVWQPATWRGGWNHFCLTADGDRIIIELNGAVTTDLRDDERTSGHLGFQLHAGTTEIWLRGIRIREL